MATLTLRNVKGTPLTYTEVDNNFSNLNNGLGGFKNKIINGNFDIWQRGTSSTITNTHIADRWRHSFGSGAGTVSRQAFTPGQTVVPGEPTYFLRHERTTAATVANNLISQRIESVRTFAGEIVTVSFYGDVSAGTKTLKLGAIQNFGTGGSTEVVIPEQDVVLTTTRQKFTFNVTLPSISTKTIGSNNDDYLEIKLVERSPHSTFTVNLAQFQIEAGSIATEFEKRHIGQELALCQRYFQRFKSLTQSAGNASWVTAYASDATRLETSFPHTTVLRAAPSASFSGLVWGLGGNILPNSVNSVVNARHFPGASWYYFAVTGATADVNYVIGFSDFNGFFDLDAEL